MSHKKKQSNRKNNREYVEKYKLYVDGPTEIDYFHRLNNLKMYKYISFSPLSSGLNGYEYDYEKDKCCLIIDIDAKDKKNSRKEYERLLSVFNNENYNVYYNNYSFESLLLLHKNKSVKPVYKSNEYDISIKRTFGVDKWSHGKTKAKRIKLLKNISIEDVLRAKENTKIYKNKTWYENPSTNFNEFFEFFEKRNERNKKKNGKDK